MSLHNEDDIFWKLILLGAVLAVCKLCGLLTWSWGWVLMPWWIAPVAFVVVCVFGLLAWIFFRAMCGLWDLVRG